ncbi:MAG: Gfo/Idh/MocA family oxidoreductase, partial [Flavobacteriales bacterium]|nr:Gfo/Idh/MocA family oxidoreductase [Flavobacteriales bacterium]
PLARAGVPLLIEKPLAADPIPADAFAEAKAPIQVGYCLRFQPALAAVAAAVWDGAVGTVRLLRAQVGQYLPDWRPGTDYRAGVTARADLGGGALRELSHEIDLALWLGGPVSGVRARLANTGALGIETDEVADLTLTFASGAVGSVQVDLLRRAPRRLLSVTGDDGTVEWDGIAATARLFRDGAWTDLTPPDDGGGDMYDRQFRHFLARVADGAAPLVGPDAGRAVLDVVAAARRSDDEGGDIAP